MKGATKKAGIDCYSYLQQVDVADKLPGDDPTSIDERPLKSQSRKTKNEQKSSGKDIRT